MFFLFNFEVATVIDLSLIGRYDITLDASIEFFNDATRSTKETLTASQTFTVFIEPCLIGSYIASVNVPQV